jgi:hypothetical protein
MRKQEPELRRGCEEVSLTDTAAFDCQKRMLVGLTNDSDCWRSVERLEFPPHDLSEARVFVRSSNYIKLGKTVHRCSMWAAGIIIVFVSV